MKKLVIILFMYMALVGGYFPDSTYAKSNFLMIKLPNGVTIDIPRNWQILGNDELTTLDTSVEAQIDLSNLPKVTSDLGFVAGYYDDTGEKAKINVRYYPDSKVTQDIVKRADPKEIRNFDTTLKKEFMKASGNTMLYWGGTRKQNIAGGIALVTEYRRPPIPGENGSFNVRLVRVLDGPKSFTLTVSYNELYAVIFKPICDRIVSSLKIRN